MDNRRMIAVPLIVGLLGLLPLFGRQRFEAFHTVDVVQLLASGMCFGVALAGFVGILRGQRKQG